jgi:hypothetical protein
VFSIRYELSEVKLYGCLQRNSFFFFLPHLFLSLQYRCDCITISLQYRCDCITISPLVDNSGKKLGEVFIQLDGVSDRDLGSKAIALASSTKAFDEAILDTVFALKNRDDQINLLDHAIAVTILASANLNPKLGMAMTSLCLFLYIIFLKKYSSYLFPHH